MKKVLIYSDCYIFGGSENVIPVLLNDLKLNQKLKIYFYYKYSYEYEKVLKKRLKFKNQNITSINFRLDNSLHKFKLRKIISLFEYIFIIYDIIIQWNYFKNLNPDIIFINNGGYPAARTCRSAVLTARLLGIRKCLFMVNNIAVPYNRLLRIIQYPIDRMIINNVDSFFTASIYSMNKMMTNVKLNRSKIDILLNTFNPQNVTINSKELKKQLDIKEDDIIIGSVGELSKRKGHHILLKSLNVLKYLNDKSFKLILVGEGEEEVHLKQLISCFNLVKNIKLVGFIDNIYNYYNIFDLYVHPTIADDDLPFAVREAMSVGLPIIATDFAGIPELIKDNYNGLLVHPGDHNQLAKKINHLINDFDKRKSLAINSKKTFNKRLSKKSILNNYYELFTKYSN